LAYGHIHYLNGTISGNTGNVTLIKNGPGNYLLTIDPNSIGQYGFDPIVTATATDTGNGALIFTYGGKMGTNTVQIMTRNGAGIPIDVSDIHFVIYNAIQ